MLSPPEGAVVRVPWVPLVVEAPAGFEGGEVEVHVDGEALGDALALTRRAFAGSVHHIATLEITELQPGEHHLRVRWRAPDGEVGRASSSFSVERAAARVRLEVTDGDDARVAARVLVRGAGGPVSMAGPSVSYDETGRDAALSSVFADDGEAVVDLEPGTYTFVAVRGLRDEVAVRTVAVVGDTLVRLPVPRVVDTPDAVLADLHVHTGRSGDAWIPDRARLRSLSAAGIDVAVVTDHNQVAGVGGRFAEAGGAMRVVDGVEVNLHDEGGPYGHMNAFPVAGADIPADQARSEVTDWLDAYAALPGSPILQLNHPRGIQFGPREPLLRGAHALFSTRGYSPSAALDTPVNVWLVTPGPSGTRPLDFDAIEVANRFSREGWLDVRADWFSLLNQGFFLTGTANSDSHALEVERAGFPSNLVHMTPPAAGEALDASAFVDAIRAGRVTASNGPVLDLSVAGTDGRTAGPGEMAGGAGLVATVRVRAAAWVPCPVVRLVVNGVAQEVTLPERDAVALDETYTWPLDPGEDAWVLAEAGEPMALLESGASAPLPEPWAWILPEYEPLAFTNPVRLDVDGDGVFTPPGL